MAVMQNDPRSRPIIRTLLSWTLLSVVISSGVIIYLAWRTGMPVRDRFVLFLLLCFCYVATFSLIGCLCLMGLGAFKKAARTVEQTVGQIPLVAHILTSLLAINVATAHFGYKKLLFANKPLLHHNIPAQILVMVLAIMVLFLLIQLLRKMQAKTSAGVTCVAGLILAAALLLGIALPGDRYRETESHKAQPVHPRESLSTRTLVLIGLDGVDWRLLRALLRTNPLPNLQRLVNEGFVSSLHYEEFGLSPIIWTSVSTGSGRAKHRIHDFVVRTSPLFKADLGVWAPLVPRGFGLSLLWAGMNASGLITNHMTTGADRRGPSVWQILSRFGYRSLVVNYMLSWPAERIKGAFLSQYIYHQQSSVEPNASIEVSPTAPTSKSGFEYPPGIFLKYGPDQGEKAAETAAEADTPIFLSEREFDFLETTAIRILQQDRFHFVTFYTHWPDTFNHSMSVEDYRQMIHGDFSSDIPQKMLRCYRKLDRFIGEICEVVGDSNVIVISDHGVKPSYMGTQLVMEHLYGPPGILLAHGPDFASGKGNTCIYARDITPTVLHYFGLPTGKDMEGKVVSEIFNEQRSAEYCESYSPIVKNERVDMTNFTLSAEVKDRLRALGYIE